jgi:hypothetical protein
MKLVLTAGYNKSLKGLKSFLNRSEISIRGDADVRSISLPNGSKLFTIGNVIGIRDTEDSIKKANDNDLSELFQFGVSDDVIRKLEGRFLMMYYDVSGNGVEVFTDRYGQFDCYYASNRNKVVIASDLSLFPESPSRKR